MGVFLAISLAATSLAFAAPPTIRSHEGIVQIWRSGKEVPAVKFDDPDFRLVPRDLVRVEEGAAILNSTGLALQLAPRTLLQWDAPAAEGRPAVATLLFGHLRVAAAPSRPGAGSPDVLRLRVPGGMVGMRAFGRGGARYLAHVSRTEQEYYARIEKGPKAEGGLPEVRALGDLQIFPELMTRVDAISGDFAFRPDEGAAVPFRQGQSLALVRPGKVIKEDGSQHRPTALPAVTKIPADELLKVLRALGWAQPTADQPKKAESSESLESEPESKSN